MDRKQSKGAPNVYKGPDRDSSEPRPGLSGVVAEDQSYMINGFLTTAGDFALSMYRWNRLRATIENVVVLQKPLIQIQCIDHGFCPFMIFQDPVVFLR